MTKRLMPPRKRTPRQVTLARLEGQTAARRQELEGKIRQETRNMRHLSRITAREREVYDKWQAALKGGNAKAAAFYKKKLKTLSEGWDKERRRLTHKLNRTRKMKPRMPKKVPRYDPSLVITD